MLLRKIGSFPSRTIRGRRILSLSRQFFTDIHVHPEVAEALKHNRPVVALESSIISHGMPPPQNLQLAQKVENIIRENGAIPATVAIINGFPKIGLSNAEMKLLVDSSVKSTVAKVSRRDIAYACAHRCNGGTTVASTMLLASMAGIRVFATGGIGGVHRGAAETFDISADLQELSRSPVTVVSSGVKSILDIPKTLEVLESYGVPVCGYQTSSFPAFFTNESGYRAPMEVDSALAVARMMACQDDLKLGQGMLVAVPNPQPSPDIEAAIQEALQQAKAEGVEGSKITPYVLSKLEKLTEGKSLQANVALVENNAKVGALIACAYAPLSRQAPQKASHSSTSASSTDPAEDDELKKNTSALLQFLKEKSRQQKTAAVQSEDSLPSSEVDALWRVLTSDTSNAPEKEVPSPPKSDEKSDSGSKSGDSSGDNKAKPQESSDASSEVIIFGGAVLDQIMTPSDTSKPLTINSSNPGHIRTSYGGVGRNMAEAIARLGLVRPLLVSAVGNDLAGEGLLRHSDSLGIQVSCIQRPHELDCDDNSFRTATYAAVHDHRGDLAVAIADMDIFQKLITPALVATLERQIKSAKLVAVDGNLSVEALKAVATVCSSNGKPLLFEPTSDHKCLLPVEAGVLDKVDIIVPNVSELRAIMRECCSRENMTVSKKAMVMKSLQRMSRPDTLVLASSLLDLMTSAANKKDFIHDKCVGGKHVIVTLGELGVLWVSSNGRAMGWDGKSRSGEQGIVHSIDNVFSRHIPPFTPPESIVNTCGAGDTFAAGLIHSIVNPPVDDALARSGGPTLSSIEFAMKFAEKSLGSHSAVPTKLVD